MADKKKTAAKETSADKKKRGGMTARAASDGLSRLRSTMEEVPLRYFAAFFASVMCLMFLSVLIHPDGALPIWVAGVWKGLHGVQVFYCSVPAFAWMVWILLSGKGRRVRLRTFCVMGALLLTGCLAHMILKPELPEDAAGFALISALYESGLQGRSGGVLCGGFAMMLEFVFGRFFTYCLLIVGWGLCLLRGLHVSALVLWHRCAAQTSGTVQKLKQLRETYQGDSDGWHPVEGMVDRFASRRAERVQLRKEQEQKLIESVQEEAPVVPVTAVPSEAEVTAQIAAEPAAVAAAPAKQKVTAQEAALSAALVEQEIAAARAEERPEYCFPPIDLLDLPRGKAADGTAEMRENTRRLNETLASFKIEAHISNVTRGPSVTRYEVELEKGVRLNKLTTCADDIALSLGASGVRIAPVPGKISVVGIEVPNQSVSVVSLREVIDSPEFNRAKSHSAIAVGKDIGGSCIIGNIAKFPHMLIAGTTGSGKSVCMNSIIISLLYKSSPEDVKLIMVDPKMVELGIYNGIPHLLIPVVTDPKKAAGSLQWAVTEMMRRYRSMSDAGVRDLESYNSMILGGELEGEKLPQIVVIIDELADLMLVAAKEVEESICRIAQMGRAAGIHLIIATQRPSADVITGLMKANIPSRIAFSVASAMESRIILDTQGAEKLVGKGDMLYSPIGSGKPQRVQGCFVTDAEVEAVASYVKEHYATTYDQSVMDDIARKAEQTGTKNAAPPTASDPDPSADELAGDEMLPAAVDVILETKQASVSMLQRRLKLGYARAARIVDEMEEKGIVGPFMGSKPRQILITKEQWEQMKGGQTLVVEPPFDLDDDPVPDELM